MILEKLGLDQNEKETLEHIVKQMETERGLDRSAAIAHMRFDFIEKVCAETVIKPHESKEHLRSQKMDKILTGKYTAIPCFAGIMALVFWLTFGVIGKGLSDLLDMGITWLTAVVDQAMTAWNVNNVLHSLVIDGISMELEVCSAFCRLSSPCFSSCHFWKTVATWPEWHL